MVIISSRNGILADCRTQVRSFRIEMFSALEMYFLLTQVDENSFTIPTAANGWIWAECCCLDRLRLWEEWIQGAVHSIRVLVVVYTSKFAQDLNFRLGIQNQRKTLTTDKKWMSFFTSIIKGSDKNWAHFLENKVNFKDYLKMSVIESFRLVF